MYLDLDLSDDFLSWFDWVYVIGGGTEIQAIPITSYQDYVVSTYVTNNINIGIDHLDKVVFARFLQCKTNFPPSFCTLLFGSKLLSTTHTQEEWKELSSLFWKENIYINYLEFSV